MTVDADLIANGNEDDEGLTANYVGGAAGRYATTKVVVTNQVVDPKSPRKHGRFTATARLMANFGMHETIDKDARNQISGEITDFNDGTLNLGFGVVKLGAITITPGDGTQGNGMLEDGDNLDNI